MRVVLCDDNPKERDLYTRLVEQILGEEGIDADIGVRSARERRSRV